eukprot:scaffold112726_cov20-Tisochrysis_lutea.AAC.1
MGRCMCGVASRSSSGMGMAPARLFTAIEAQDRAEALTVRDMDAQYDAVSEQAYHRIADRARLEKRSPLYAIPHSSLDGCSVLDERVQSGTHQNVQEGMSRKSPSREVRREGNMDLEGFWQHLVIDLCLSILMRIDHAFIGTPSCAIWDGCGACTSWAGKVNRYLRLRGQLNGNTGACFQTWPSLAGFCGACPSLLNR